MENITREEALILLNAPERLGNLRKLVAAARAGELPVPETREDVNNHIHTTYSFSPYSPTAAVWFSWQAGLCTCGLIDHDSIGGADEFLEACGIVGIPGTVGIECRATMDGTPFAGKKFNNPDQVGTTYLTIHGVPHDQTRALNEYFAPRRALRNVRNRKMVSGINAVMRPFGIELDFERDVVPLSNYPVGGTVTERHLSSALAYKMIKRFGAGQGLVDFIKHELKLPIAPRVEGYLLNSGNPFMMYDLLGWIKAELIARFYVDATDELFELKEILDHANQIGAIMAYPYLGDVGDSVTGDKRAQQFEDSFLDELFPYLKQIGFKAVSYMPSRNTPAQISRLRALCDRYDMFQISGEDINQPRQPFVCMAQRAPEFRNLYESTWALIAHEARSTGHPERGFFAEAAIREHPNLNERILAFAEMGRKNVKGNDMMYLAHSGSGARPEGQPLTEHLTAVANIAAGYFDDRFFSRLAWLIGLYHDAGKYKADVQRHIRESNNEKIDHATMGGRLLSERFRERDPLQVIAAMPILGHHGGMPDADGGVHRRSMSARLRDPLPEDAIRAFLREMDQGTGPIDYPKPRLIATKNTAAFEIYMAIHMLHSALVDADFLDTEAFYDPEQAALRGKRPRLDSLLTRYASYMKKKTTEHAPGEEAHDASAPNINGIRAEINAQCVDAAERPQGFFSLSVPTGGGKTLASLGFALHHAQRHQHIERIIYAIPFTSIIEQNAQVFREALGEDAVLEHHSAVAPPKERTEEGTGSSTRLDRAAENWDAPIVVTSNVQLFESLFSNKPSKCRKLHNLRNSIIILDEMQALPDAQLRPCLMALHSLVTNHGATVVICTATQPNYDKAWPEVPAVTEIMRDVGALFNRMRRTRFIDLGPLNDDALITRLTSHEQVLVIVNNRAHARSLHVALGGEEQGAYHLTTLMCAEHRSYKLNEVHERLKKGERVRLISTSLIEAGVDVDFPVVYRAAAGLDSLIQAAGRCNRNMKQSQLAPVYTFEPVDWRAPGQVTRLASMTRAEVAVNHEDLMSLAASRQYFALRFGPAADLDAKKILSSIAEHYDARYPFERIALDFEMIQSAGEAVFIPYDDKARALIAQLAEDMPSRGLLRKLQRYSITVYDNQRKELNERGFLKRVGGALVLDVSDAQLKNTYTDEAGLDPNGTLAFEMK